MKIRKILKCKSETREIYEMVEEKSMVKKHK